MSKRPIRHDHPLVEIRHSRIHGYGAYACVPMRKGKRIIEYVGPKLTKAEAEAELEKFNEYVFTLDDSHDIDGSVLWNTARYLNHSCDPNCRTDIVRGRVWIYALRAIRQGEELTYNYGHEVDDYEERPCCCGAENCLGYRVAEACRSDLLERLKQQAK